MIFRMLIDQLKMYISVEGWNNLQYNVYFFICTTPMKWVHLSHRNTLCRMMHAPGKRDIELEDALIESVEV